MNELLLNEKQSIQYYNLTSTLYNNNIRVQKRPKRYICVVSRYFLIFCGLKYLSDFLMINMFSFYKKKRKKEDISKKKSQVNLSLEALITVIKVKLFSLIVHINISSHSFLLIERGLRDCEFKSSWRRK